MLEVIIKANLVSFNKNSTRFFPPVFCPDFFSYLCLPVSFRGGCWYITASEASGWDANGRTMLGLETRQESINCIVRKMNDFQIKVGRAVFQLAVYVSYMMLLYP